MSRQPLHRNIKAEMSWPGGARNVSVVSGGRLIGDGSG